MPAHSQVEHPQRGRRRRSIDSCLSEGLVALEAIAKTTEAVGQEGGSEYALLWEMMVVEEQELKNLLKFKVSLITKNCIAIQIRFRLTIYGKINFLD